ncbi:YbaK/EbsC family protein [bacterium]|nr:YbaK/EbsC family protein [bacterium]
MAIDKVREYMKKYGRENDIMEFGVSSATVSEAAQAIGCDEASIAKTLSFIVNNIPIVIVVAGDKKIDNRKYKDYFHEKAKMVPYDKLAEIIGHEAGGVCPFGLNEGVLVYLDKSLKEHDIVYPACGSHNSAIKLSIDELENITNFEDWIDVSK